MSRRKSPNLRTWRGGDETADKIDEMIYLFSVRKLETYFLQKRFTIYNHKPEMILKEDTEELKLELVCSRVRNVFIFPSCISNFSNARMF